MPTADVGPVNPLPPIFGSGNADRTADMAQATQEMRANATHGRVDTVCPYLLQDGYTRQRTIQQHPVAVLENDRLRATFLLNAGGRLWSLVHKESGTDLLFTNPIFQPANLALRNAWFAGGVEWNIGTTGHTTGTCEPIHAARVQSAEGHDVLRLYEFERMRRVVFAIDVHLPDASDVLFVSVRIVNPNDHDVPMYWWSNIAVTQTAHTRVLAPARSAWNYSYDQVVRLVPVAEDGQDVSYPAAAQDAADFFFELASHPQPWIAAVDERGAGVFQTSTPQLLGRKLFRWGTGSGGRRWQDWLTGSRDGYAEIQAGLARTQFEHLRMPAGASWTWVEAYGRIDLPADLAHSDWDGATVAAQEAVTRTVSAERLAAVQQAAEALAYREPVELLHTASGWGALENRVRLRSGEPALNVPGTPFDASTLGLEQAGWLAALDTGQFPEAPPDGFPASVHLHPVFEDLLVHSTGWTAPAVIGVIKACRGDLEGARAAWIASLGRTSNALAWRNLGTAALYQGDLGAALTSYRRAVELAPGEPSLIIETVRALLAANEPLEALDLINSCAEAIRTIGRIRFLEARAALAAGDVRRCEAILADLEVPDLREGEDSLAELWWDLQAAIAVGGPDAATKSTSDIRAEVERIVSVPAHLDFRMRTSTPEPPG
jgi:hypothetical protein